jgi:hypothetical protein
VSPINRFFPSQIFSILEFYFSFIFVSPHFTLSMFFFFIVPLDERISTTRDQSTGVFPINVFLLHFSTSPKKIDDIISPIKPLALLTYFFSLLALRIPFSMIFFLILPFAERMSATHKFNQQVFFQSNS